MMPRVLMIRFFKNVLGRDPRAPLEAQGLAELFGRCLRVAAIGAVPEVLGMTGVFGHVVC